jgi:hypothetical protein
MTDPEPRRLTVPQTRDAKTGRWVNREAEAILAQLARPHPADAISIAPPEPDAELWQDPRDAEDQEAGPAWLWFWVVVVVALIVTGIWVAWHG